MKTNYNFWKGLKKVIISLVIVGVPLVIQVLPNEYANLTLSGALLLILNWLKTSQGLKI